VAEKPIAIEKAHTDSRIERNRIAQNQIWIQKSGSKSPDRIIKIETFASILAIVQHTQN
jgi:hypothetical protein